MQSDRIVPKTPTGSDVHIGAEALRMNLEDYVPADPARQVPQERIYATGDGKTRLHHVFDPQSGLSFVVFRGAAVARHEAAFRARVSPYTLDEIVAEAKAAKGKKRVAALYRLGIAAPAKLDRRVLDLLAAAMHDRDRKVRQAAVWATAYAAWPHFREPLEAVRESDRDPEIRGDAALILQAMDAAG